LVYDDDKDERHNERIRISDESWVDNEKEEKISEELGRLADQTRIRPVDSRRKRLRGKR
jgi:hypothetical protein